MRLSSQHTLARPWGLVLVLYYVVSIKVTVTLIGDFCLCYRAPRAPVEQASTARGPRRGARNFVSRKSKRGPSCVPLALGKTSLGKNWPGHMGTDEARATWALPIGCNSHGPRVTVFLIRQSDLLLLLCGLLAPLALSPSRAHLPLPTKLLISREPQRAGCRAVVGT
jgi:hypothetical protein